jgi:hypothetical protein
LPRNMHSQSVEKGRHQATRRTPPSMATSIVAG